LIPLIPFVPGIPRDPVGPVTPSNPFSPGAPLEPVGPVTPSIPSRPSQPFSPFSPVGPVGPSITKGGSKPFFIIRFHIELGYSLIGLSDFPEDGLEPHDCLELLELLELIELESEQTDSESLSVFSGPGHPQPRRGEQDLELERPRLRSP